jgi:hypothetical protein
MSKIIFFGPEMPGPGMAVETIQGNTGGPVPPNLANNIFVVGDGVSVDVVGNPGGNTLTITTPGLPNIFHTDNGDATVAAGAISILGGLNVDTSGAGAIITINANTGSQVVRYVNITFANSPYAVFDNDYYLSCDLSLGAITILLPDAPAIGRIFTIKDRKGLAATDNITVRTVSGAGTIDGDIFFLMNNNYESLSVIYGNDGYEIY